MWSMRCRRLFRLFLAALAVFADSCFCGSGTAWIAPSHAQPHIDSVVCLRFGSSWGNTFLLLFAASMVVYVAGGLLLARQRGGGGGGGGGNERTPGPLGAHPHAWRWRELLALCRDGIAFVRSGGAKRSQHRTAAPVRTSFLPTDESSATAKTAKNSRDSSSSSKKKNGKEHRKEKSGSEPLAAVAEPAMPVGGTPAGGGGRQHSKRPQHVLAELLHAKWSTLCLGIWRFWTSLHFRCIPNRKWCPTT